MKIISRTGRAMATSGAVSPPREWATSTTGSGRSARAPVTTWAYCAVPA